MLLEPLVFIFGAIIGSFLNVCIVRMPHEESIVKPRSHCVQCKKMVPWYDNIPFISWIVLGGKCRFCKHKISFRYFFVELLTAGAFLGLYTYFGLQWLLLPYLILISGFIVATFTDFEHRIIPDEISLNFTLYGFILSGCIPALHNTASYEIAMGRSLMGFLIGGGIIYGLGVFGDFLFKKETMGGGDVKLLAMIGVFLGWKLAILTFFIAPVFGAVYGVIEKIRTKDPHIAYGPFLIVGALISIFWGDPIIAWILRGYGL